jgi:predicted MPP superfamily phosphohydrolase
MISRRGFLAGICSLALPAGGVAYGVGIEPYRVTIASYNVRLPKWHGAKLRIAALADIHACDPFMSLKHLRHIVDTTNALQPCITVLLGDYVADLSVPFQRLPEAQWAHALSALRAPLGVHAILGNHDWWSDADVMRKLSGIPRARRALEDAGIPVYENDARRLTKGGQSFWLGGLGDQWAFRAASRKIEGRRTRIYMGVDDVPGLLHKIDDDAPIILMAHEPDIFASLPDRISLTLAGHMHAGQVCIAGYAPSLPSKFGARYRYGHIVEGGRQMIVSGGLGCSYLPIRIGAPPEIVVVNIEGIQEPTLDGRHS